MNTAFQKQLLNWFESAQRPLPWRVHYRPYEVWISEMMLQQTQVKTVLPYYDRWMKALPSIESLAKASEEEVMKLWEGLGYYSRARNLHKAAKYIMEHHDGKFPSTYETVRALPGIGPYTTGAILSIAFNQEHPIVDGNVIRIMCRLMDYRESPKSSKMQQKLWRHAEEWIPKGKARYFNQAMMELGATVCQVKSPHCLLCPVSEHCASRKAGSVEQVPFKEAKKSATPVTKALAIIQRSEKFLVQQRMQPGLMSGLWEFPNLEFPADASIFEKPLQDYLKSETGISASIHGKLATLKHSYTSFRATVHCFCADYVSGEVSADHQKWLSWDELHSKSFPGFYKKLFAELKKEVSTEEY